MLNPRTTFSSGPDDNKALQDLLEHHLPLVRSIVGRMKRKLPSNVETEDLYSIGLTGLVAAARNYRFSQPGTFAAYAVIRITGAILDELQDGLDEPCQPIESQASQFSCWNKNKVEASARTLSAPKCK